MAAARIPAERPEAFCRKWSVRESSVFGSAVRDDPALESDVGVLISSVDDAPWSPWDFATMREELSALVGRPVDPVERKGPRNPFRRHRFLKTRKVIYDGPGG